MKTLALTLFLYFSIFTSGVIYAGNNTINAAYPPPSGTYNKVVLSNLQNANIPDCTKSSNAGMIFMYTDPTSHAQSLEICANGTNMQVPYPETCFNRFCSNGNGLVCPGGPAITQSLSNGMKKSDSGYYNPCPPGYTQGISGTTALVDTYSPDGGTTNFYSTVCCTTPTINNITTNSAVVPTQ